MTNKIVDNSSGIGLVAAYCQNAIDEQIEFVRKHSTELPPRTKQEEKEMAWDDSLML